MQNKKIDKDWYKNCVFYGIDVATFRDSNGDGIGDFNGIRDQVNYLTSLGVKCVWLLPFYPTQRKDNGYDITEYRNVDSRYGTLTEFKLLVDTLHQHGIRVIIDIVLHHTSNEHAWFHLSKLEPKSKYKEYYLWSDNIPPTTLTEKNAFPGFEHGVWTFDETAKKYYRHKFYSFEPDLNTSNKDVQEEIFSVVDFWLAMGIDGFRMDAAALFFPEHGEDGGILEKKAFFKKLRAFTGKRNPEAVIFGEVDVPADKISDYVQEGEGMHMLLNFLVNNSFFHALARESAEPLIKIYKELPKIPKSFFWINFIRNMDELNVMQLSEADQEQVFKKFAPHANMKIFGRGIRRRTTPMLKGEINALKMAWTLLFTLPGSPLIIYGDEIGMGEDLSLPERNSVRTPMQWTAEKNAGFSQADKKRLVTPVISKGPYRFGVVNVAQQEAHDGTLLQYIKKLVCLRYDLEPLRSGDCELLEVDNEHVFALMHKTKKESLITLHNLTNQKVTVKLSLKSHKHCEELISDSSYNPKENEELTLNAYGFRWFLIKS